MRPATERVKETLSPIDVHQTWGESFLAEPLDSFYESAFDFIRDQILTQPGQLILDAGCGLGRHAVRLARRGFEVVGIDYAASALRVAQQHIQQTGNQGNIKLAAADMLNLGIQDAAFDHVISWGVLVHIPEVDQAIAELARVLRPGGCLVLVEANLHSLESRLMRRLSPLLRKEGARLLSAGEKGVEYWVQTPQGELLSRHTNMDWLHRELAHHDLSVRTHIASQFFQVYVKFRPGALQQGIHWFNRIWFEKIRRPGPSFGNMIIAAKA